jgi:arylsulfatase A-like enzyme
VWGAARAALLLFGCELALARWSSLPQTWGDVARSGGVLALVAVVPFLLVRRSRLSSGGVRAGLAVASGGPLLAVAFGIALPVLFRFHGPFAAAALTGAGAWLFARHVAGARRGGALVPPAWSVPAAVGISAALAWLAQPGSLPPAAIWLPFAASAAALWGLLMRPALAPLALALALGIARLPESPPEIVWPEARTPGRGPDVVLLSVDTLRADAAPAMWAYRRLAAAGVQFPAVQAPAPWTLPSMATLMTGRTPAEHGARRLASGGFSGLAPGYPTLAERLAGAGWDTAAVVGANPFVGAGFGFERGFDVFLHASESARFALPRWVGGFGSGGARPVLADALTRLRLAPARPFADDDSRVDLALHLLARRRERPLFLWIHLLDPHLPYTHTGGSGLGFRDRRALDAIQGPEDVRGDARWAASGGRAVLKRAYAHEVAVTDRALVRLLDALGEAPPHGRVVVLTSDHGEEFFEHAGFEHGHALYQEVVSVPLVISGLAGERAAGSVEPHTVGLVDVPATLLAAAGLADPDLVGQDLAGPVAVRSYRSENLLYGDPSDAQRAARRGDWKAILGASGTLALYDLARDPAESHDRAATHLALARDLVEPVLPAAPSGARVTLREHELGALRALGYLAD